MRNKAEAQLQKQAFDWDFFPYEVQLTFILNNGILREDYGYLF